MNNSKLPCRALVALAVGMICFGCKSSEPAAAPQAAVVIDANTTDAVSMAQKTANVYVGEIFRVRLPAQSGTGFSWTVEGVNTNIVSLISRGTDHDVDKKSGKPATQPGAPTYEVFDFKAVRSGETRIDFIYNRSWERNVAPAKRFSLRVDAGY